MITEYLTLIVVFIVIMFTLVFVEVTIVSMLPDTRFVVGGSF